MSKNWTLQIQWKQKCLEFMKHTLQELWRIEPISRHYTWSSVTIPFGNGHTWTCFQTISTLIHVCIFLQHRFKQSLGEMNGWQNSKWNCLLAPWCYLTTLSKACLPLPKHYSLTFMKKCSNFWFWLERAVIRKAINSNIETMLLNVVTVTGAVNKNPFSLTSKS